MGKEQRIITWIDPCGWVDGKGHRVSFVKEGESGHYPSGGGLTAPWYWGDPNDCGRSLKLAEETCEAYNLQRFKKKEVDEILASSFRASFAEKREVAKREIQAAIETLYQFDGYLTEEDIDKIESLRERV